MAQKYYSEEEMRTIDLIKQGTENCLFTTPLMVVDAMKKFFGDADVSIKENTPNKNAFTIHCKSARWSSTKYHRIFIFTFCKVNDRENKIIATTEVSEA